MPPNGPGEERVLAGLIAMRRMLARPGSWTQNALARDADGFELNQHEIDELVRNAKGGDGGPHEPHDGNLHRRGGAARGSDAGPVMSPQAEALAHAISERLADEIRRSHNDLPGLDGDDEALRALAPVFGLTPAWYLMETWNNASHRTHEHVLELLDRAIARQRARLAAERVAQ